MNVKICTTDYGVIFNGPAAGIEASEFNDDILFTVTELDGQKRNIKAKNDYVILRIGEKPGKKVSGLLSVKKKPTTYDLAKEFDRAVKTLKDAGVDTSKISFYLPDENGFMQAYGPMTVEEARDICREYWGI